MSQVNPAGTSRPQQGNRSGASRKLLMRKAREAAFADAPRAEALEASFPHAAGDEAASASPSEVTALAVIISRDHPASAGSVALPPTTAPTWSSEDEGTYRTLLAQRKAAGYQRRGREVSGQLLTAGTIKPNPNTVAAVILNLVAGSGRMSRGELVVALATATFPHPKARPGDKGWCQGYIAGALRNGFLAVAEQATVAPVNAA